MYYFIRSSYIIRRFFRAWGDEVKPRIAVYDTVKETWKYAFYPLDQPESQYGGWVGLSDIAALGDGMFMVLERDNQGGPDAAVKRIYTIDLYNYSFEDGTVLTKTLYMDLVESGALTETNGNIIEKVEGLAVMANKGIWINTDNDGVDDNSGESLLAMVGKYKEKCSKRTKKAKCNKIEGCSWLGNKKKCRSAPTTGECMGKKKFKCKKFGCKWLKGKKKCVGRWE